MALPDVRSTTGGAAAIESPHPLLRVRVGGLRLAAAIALVAAMAALSAILAATSDHVQYPTATAAYYSFIVASSMLAGLYWSVRRPDSRFGALLQAFGVAAWVVSWQSSNLPLAYDIGVLADGAAFFLTFWLFLTFPSGRLTGAVDRVLIAALLVGVLGFFVPWALLSPVIAGGGPLATCVPACPSNVLQVGTDPGAVDFLGRWETYIMLAATLAVLAVYWRRVMSASRPQRRSIVAVATTSLLFLPVFFAFHFMRQIVEAPPAVLDPLAWLLIAMRIVLPVGFLVALLQAELFAGAARGRLLEQLLRRPTPEQWRGAVAGALDDPAARLGFWDVGAQNYREPGGGVLAPPAPGTARAWVPVEHYGAPVAALVIDDALAEDPELVSAATSATVLAVENGALEGELRASRARIAAAGDAERRRIERDLHDSAQQRLVALRMQLERTGERLDGSEDRAMVQRLGRDVEQAIDDLRTVASGLYPATLTDLGLAAALRNVARRAAIPVGVRDAGIGRHAPTVEATAYFCCVEALQNAAKHAGPASSATVRLAVGVGVLTFEVEDDGAGFDLDTVVRGHGLDNLADRLSAIGGTLEIDAAPGRGTVVRGRVPLAERAEAPAAPMA